MKKGHSILLASLIGCTILGTVTPLTASAATDGHIQLQENNTATDPVDPEDPSQKLPIPDPENPATGSRGPLSVDVAPSSFEFGVQKMYSSEHVYTAEKANPAHTRQYLQVTDNRDSTTNGWRLVVKQDKYLDDNGYELTGATISLPAGTARNSLNTPSTAPDTTLVTSAVGITNQDQTVFATSSDAATIGKAQSTSVWTPEGVTLTIPAGVAKAGNYTNTINWTMVAGTT